MPPRCIAQPILQPIIRPGLLQSVYFHAVPYLKDNIDHYKTLGLEANASAADVKR